MRILYMAAGNMVFGGGATVRDAAFIRGLAENGHEVRAISLYGPIHIEGQEKPCEFFHSFGNTRVHGVFPRLLGIPSTLVSFLQQSRPLSALTSFAIGGRFDKAGPRMVRILAGRDKRQHREYASLMELYSGVPKPDIVVLANILLLGLAEPLRAGFSCPVVCLSQGSDRFIECLEEPYRSDARKLIRRHAKLLRLVITTSRFSVIRAIEFMALPTGSVHSVPPGIDVGNFTNDQPRRRHPFVIGYRAPIRKERGLDILVDAADTLLRDSGVDVHLWISGRIDDNRYWMRLKRRLESRLLMDRHRYFGDITGEELKAFMRELSVFAMPFREPEWRGMELLQTMAMGVPAVAPSTGIVPELFQHANGGLLVSPEVPVWMFAQAFKLLAEVPETADQLGQEASERVKRHFSIHHSSAAFAVILADAAGLPAAPGVAGGGERVNTVPCATIMPH